MNEEILMRGLRELEWELLEDGSYRLAPDWDTFLKIFFTALDRDELARWQAAQVASGKSWPDFMTDRMAQVRRDHGMLADPAA